MIKSVSTFFLILVISSAINSQGFENFSVEKDSLYSSFLSKLKGSELYDESFKFLKNYETLLKQWDTTSLIKIYADLNKYNNEVEKIVATKSIDKYRGNLANYNNEADAFIAFYKELDLLEKLHPFFVRKINLIDIDFIEPSNYLMDEIILHYAYLCKTDYTKADFYLNWFIKNKSKLSLCDLKLDMLKLSLHKEFSNLNEMNIILNDLSRSIINSINSKDCNNKNLIIKAKINSCINKIKLQKYDNLQEEITTFLDTLGSSNIDLDYLDDYAYLLKLVPEYAIITKNGTVLEKWVTKVFNFFEIFGQLWAPDEFNTELTDVFRINSLINKWVKIIGKSPVYAGESILLLNRLLNYIEPDKNIFEDEKFRNDFEGLCELSLMPFFFQEFIKKKINNETKTKVFYEKINFFEEAMLIFKASNVLDKNLFTRSGETDEAVTLFLENITTANPSIERSQNLIYIINNHKKLIDHFSIISLAIQNDIDLLNYQFYYLPEMHQLDIQKVIANNFQEYQKIIRREKINDNIINKLLLLSQYIKNTNVNSTNFIIENQDQISKELFKQWQQLRVESINDVTSIKINDTEARIKSDLKTKGLSKKVKNKALRAGLNIDFGFYNYNFDPFLTIKEDSIVYYAMIHDEKKQLARVIDLCSEKELKRMFQINLLDSKGINNLYATRSSTGSTTVSLPKSNIDLYDLVIKPLEKYLNNSDTINFTVSGLLNTVNIEAIQDENGNLIGNKYKMYLRNSLISSEPKSKKTLQKMAIIGDIKFNTYTYLTASKEEVDSISFIAKDNKWKTNEFFGSNANNKIIIDKLKKNENDILFFSTHGTINYIKNENSSNGSNSSIDFKKFSYYKSLSQAGLIVKDSDNNDVLLSAFDISKLNLSNTNLVVLSACETALGQIEGYEGVIGLQRAFKIAGADKLLMTLWSVSDDHTKDFMIDFMKNYFRNPDGAKDVFKNTVNNIRAKYPDPYFWAGFILLE